MVTSFSTGLLQLPVVPAQTLTVHREQALKCQWFLWTQVDSEQLVHCMCYSLSRGTANFGLAEASAHVWEDIEKHCKEVD